MARRRTPEPNGTAPEPARYVRTGKKKGRPSKANEARYAKVIEGIELGMTIESAARYAGIGPSTLHEWRRDTPAFAAQVDQAIADSEAILLAKLQSYGTGDWRSVAWMLERRFPELYGKTINLNGMINIAKVQVIIQAVFEAIEQVADEETVEALFTVLDQRAATELVAIQTGAMPSEEANP